MADKENIISNQNVSSRKNLNKIPKIRLNFETESDVAPTTSTSGSDSSNNVSPSVASLCGDYEQMDSTWDPSFESPAATTSTSRTQGTQTRFTPDTSLNLCSTAAKSSKASTQRRFSRVCLKFSSESSDEESTKTPPVNRDQRNFFLSQVSTTPPHKKLRSLRINDHFDFPNTPAPVASTSGINNRVCQSARQRRPVSRLRPKQKILNKSLNNQRYNTPRTVDGLPVNINPFTPSLSGHRSKCLTLGKPKATATPKSASASKSATIKEDDENKMVISDGEEKAAPSPITPRLMVQQFNTCRYGEEFVELCRLGDGHFGSVYKCINRLDGCTYAIKKTKAPVVGGFYERTALNEVYAHAVLGKHPHMVRYYSAWAEDDHVYIQNEFCEGGSLVDILEHEDESKRKLNESELKSLLLQLALGLRFIHSQQLVHMDIKPGNVFVHEQTEADSGMGESDFEPLTDEEGQTNNDRNVIYKLGDLGHVTAKGYPVLDEGDCRYMASDVLDTGYRADFSADVFSLGLTVYEMGGGGPFQKNGEEWHKARKGLLPPLKNISEELNNLILSMMGPTEDRPTASAIINSKALISIKKNTKLQLRLQLSRERFRNSELERQVALLKAQQEKSGSPRTPKASDVFNNWAPNWVRNRWTPTTTQGKTLVGNANGVKVNRSVSLM